jgi:hypothetical protein
MNITNLTSIFFYDLNNAFFLYKLSSSCPCGGGGGAPPAPPCPYNLVIIGVTISSNCFLCSFNSSVSAA